MNIHRSIARRQLDRHLDGLDEVVPVCPPQGWAKTIRRALGMSTGELAKRLMLSQSRVSQLERSETDGSIRLLALHRVASALNCRLVYAFVPNDPLDRMVHEQARRKVADELGLRVPPTGAEDETQEFVDDLLALLDGLAIEWVDKQGLWSLRPQSLTRTTLPSLAPSANRS